MNALEILREVSEALPSVSWSTTSESFAHQGDSPTGWHFLVAKDGEHYDGTAMRAGIVMRLTPELARKA